MNNTRAYSQLEVKSYDDEQRIIKGWATTPEPDRVGDIVDPMGAQFKNPMPLLWQHRHDQPVGSVEFGKATRQGIPFTAKLPKLTEDSPLRDRVEDAWACVREGIVRTVSIGFRVLQDGMELLPSGGVKFTNTEIYELSLVSVPANANATITEIKAYDKGLLSAATGTTEQEPEPQTSTPARAMGTKSVVVTLARAKGTKMSKLQESLKNYQDALDAKKAERTTTVTKSLDEGRTVTADEKETIDTLTQEIKALEEQIEMVKGLIASDVATAKAVDGTTEQKGIESRKMAPAVISVRGDEKPGIGFAKFALSMFAGKGEVMAAKGFAESVYGNDKRLQNVMKAAVAAGTTTSPTWAGNLVDYQNISNEFLEYLRPRTLLGQFGGTVGGVSVPSLRRVPFNVRIPGKTTAGVARWTGEGARKPVTASGYEATTLGWSKIAAISVVTDELARFSDPAILELVRDDLTDAVVERMDVDFVDPTKAAGTGTGLSPASITNGVTPIASSGNDAEAVRVDINNLWSVADAANLPTGSAVYMTNVKTARAMSMLQTTLGQPAYASVTPQGGSVNGVPLLVSNYVPDGMFILAFASEIYLADDNVVNIAYSREATIVMDDDPNATVTAAMLSNMFQENKEAIRAERYVHWKKRRPQAVAYLNNVAWGQPVTPGG